MPGAGRARAVGMAMTAGAISRYPWTPPARPSETRWVTAAMTPVAWLAGFILFAMIFYRGHA